MANTNSINLEESSSQYLSITDANQTGLDFTGDFTLEAWIKIEQLPSTVSSRFRIICRDNITTGNRAYDLMINIDDKIDLFYFDSNGKISYARIDTALTNSDVGVWMHIAVAVDVSSQTFLFYKNGDVVDSTVNVANASSVAQGDPDFAIGGRPAASPDSFFDGLIDEVRVWDDIRTSSEISDNYEKELNGDEDNLQGYWKLNNSLLDETSNNNDLTNNNSATFSDDVPFETTTTNFFQFF